MALTLSGTNGVVGAGFTVDASGVSVTAGVGTFSSVQGSGANLTALPAANLTGVLPALNAASLTSIPAANIVGVATAGFNRSGGFGKILQVVSSSGSSNITTSGSAISDLTDISITPASASNKVFLIGSCSLFTNASSNAYSGVYFYRGTSSGTQLYQAYSGSNSTTSIYFPFAISYVDSPNTTSAQTYTFAFSRQSVYTSSVTTAGLNYSLIALEIAA